MEESDPRHLLVKIVEVLDELEIPYLIAGGFSLGKIPYETMWAADRYWLPLLLSHKKFRARFFYDNPTSDDIIEKSLHEVQEI
jgi:hypothetical protein